MSGQKFETQARTREAVRVYLEAHGMTTLREIAAYVEKETGVYPSITTIGRLVRKQGYSRATVSWVREKKK